MSANYPPGQPPGGYPPPPPGGYPPPPGGYPPPQGGYPPPGAQYGGPPPGYGAPPPKKSKAWVWVLGGCLGIVLIGIIGFFVVSYVVYTKAKQAAKNAGLDTELMQKKPALAGAKAVVAMDPDLELVSSDDDKGVLTIRDKKTGEVITISADDVNKGKLSFKQNGKELGTFEVHSDSPSVEVKTGNGSATLGPGGSYAPPEWIPVYPGAALGWDYSVRDKSNVPRNGSFHFITNDDPDKIVNFYSDALKRSGLTVTTTGIQAGGGKTGVLNAIEEKGNRTLYLGVTPQTGSSNMVSIVFNSGG